MIKLGFLGAGKMATALASAILRGKLTTPADIICYDPVEQQRQLIRDTLGVRIADSGPQVLREVDMIVLAFKPQNFPEAVANLAEAIRADQIVISILAGVRIDRIRDYLPARIVRVMPNTACMVGEMAAGFAAADDLAPEDLFIVEQVLQSAGVALAVEEEQLDAVTGLSGSGPAFVAYLIQHIIAGGVKAGLPYPIARSLALQTFAGTARLLQEWQMSPEELIAMVSSPNGTTVAGREVLEQADVAEILEATVMSAAQRSRELGK